jgi:hypothetical protein
VKSQNNELRFLLEKNEKPFEIGLSDVIQKELEYLYGNANNPSNNGFISINSFMFYRVKIWPKQVSASKIAMLFCLFRSILLKCKLTSWSILV